jgi:hypothetical protein
MPRDYDDYDDPDDFHNVDEDDREASYYEYMWGGPEDEEPDAWYEGQDEDEAGENDYGEESCDWEDLDPVAPPLPAPPPGDEAAARQHFADLKRRYKAESFRDPSPLTPLYKILLTLESSKPLDKADLSWLRKNQLPGPYRAYASYEAQKCEERFKETRDPWDAVQASKFWRMAGQPTKALAATTGLAEKANVTNSRLKAAVLTTRGGAFRDLRKLDDAETCGRQAVHLNPQSFHPHMLLGAVYYQKGDPKKGDEHFAIAEKLGAKPALQDMQRKAAVSQADEPERRIVAQYLLRKDPVKYRWAKKYLQ